MKEGMPSLKESDWQEAARSCKATTGVGCHGFTPKFRLLSKETRGKAVEPLDKVEQCGRDGSNKLARRCSP